MLAFAAGRRVYPFERPLGTMVMAQNAALGEAEKRTDKRRQRMRVAKKIIIAMIMVAVAYHLLLILAYRFIDPPGSNLILATYIKTGQVEHQWVPIEKISKRLIGAVITSEDSRFCRHWGVDWRELGNAMARSGKNGPRGASTISMQTAKNVFLWPSRSYVRKVLEFPLALTMDFVWPKRRMLEIYLNIAEWGPGVFGAEAAARKHFKKSAAKLTTREAALLAASLPNPYIRRAARPGPKTRKHAGRVQKRMGSGELDIACVSSPAQSK